jgi:hypothetical protein
MELVFMNFGWGHNIMGCDYYGIITREEGYSSSLHFSDLDEEWECLCTFPYNDQGKLDSSRVRSLALLGAAVVLAHNGELDNPLLPNGVPEWIREEIKRIIPDEITSCTNDEYAQKIIAWNKATRDAKNIKGDNI